MNARELEEYRVLRATIRERGTARVCLFLFGLVAWGALTITTASVTELPIATFLPLLVLAGAFEAVSSLNSGVERIGRYIQVFLEGDDGGWEQTTMALGESRRGGGTDPLFTLCFLGALSLNVVPVLLVGPEPVEVTVIGAVHLLLAARILTARHAATKLRAVELDRYRRLKAEQSSRGSRVKGEG